MDCRICKNFSILLIIKLFCHQSFNWIPVTIPWINSTTWKSDFRAEINIVEIRNTYLFMFDDLSTTNCNFSIFLWTSSSFNDLYIWFNKFLIHKIGSIISALNVEHFVSFFPCYIIRTEMFPELFFENWQFIMLFSCIIINMHSLHKVFLI